MPGQVIESSFSPRVSEPFAQQTADAFGRAAALQQNLQIEQARNQLTQQSINIDAARQQTTAQLYNAEAAATSARTDLLQKMMPGQLKLQDLDVESQKALAAGRSIYSPMQMAADAKAMAQANLKMMGSQSDKSGVEAAFAAQQIRENLKNQEATRALTVAHTNQINQAKKDSDEQLRQNHGMQLAQMAMQPGADPEVFKKQLAVMGSGTMADFISPDQIGSTDPQKIYETAAAKAMKDPGHPAFGAAMALQGQIAASRNGLIAPPRDNPLASLAGKTQSNPGQDAVSSFTNALQAIRDKQSAGVANSGGTSSGVNSASSEGEFFGPSPFTYKPTGNSVVDSSLKSATGSDAKSIANVKLGDATPVQLKNGRNFLSSAGISKDGSLDFGSQVQKQMLQGYSTEEADSIKSVMKMDASATFQQQNTYNDVLKDILLNHDLHDKKDLQTVQDNIRAASQWISSAQKTKLINLVKDFK